METIVFLIIAGILSSIFGKAKGKKSPVRAKPFTVKGFDDFLTKVDQQLGNTSINTRQISTVQPVQHKFQDIEENQHVKVDSQMAPAEPVKRTVPAMKKVVTEDFKFERPDEKTIINGIIWAEILGEPRAKKPYLSKKG
ncbi:hypothetical protein [Bacillus sp. OK048]|uniref:hypothetical protein n=1 Tax=Bacillus sp. OK048 TaxID=1882761 RepID=UPI000888EB1F|nr:hypothetical protein [Bacillus sp. OK048]SDM19890.1 hypothetical protein SAMN05443253_102269 [Bacillus sp. OK048]